MNTVKPTKTGLAKISVPHEKQTEYLIDGVPNVRIRVGATGNLGFSLLNRVDGKMRRISMEVHDMTISATDILFESARSSGNANFSAGSYSPAGSCRVGQTVVNAHPVITYTPAAEILNAAYPVRLEQLP